MSKSLHELADAKAVFETEFIAGTFCRNVENGTRLAYPIVRATILIHHVLTEVTLSHESVVRRAHERNIIRTAVTSEAIGIVVVVLEALSRGAALSVGDVRALSAVAFVHDAPYRRGNVTGAR